MYENSSKFRIELCDAKINDLLENISNYQQLFKALNNGLSLFYEDYFLYKTSLIFMEELSKNIEISNKEVEFLKSKKDFLINKNKTI